jgi:hypothetical protein
MGNAVLETGHFSERPVMIRWEYLVVDLEGSLFGEGATKIGRQQQKLSELGAQGWELVMVTSLALEEVTRRLYFKRPVVNAGA